MHKVKLGETLSVKHGWSFKGEYFADNGEQSLLTPGNFYEKGGFKPNNGKERYYTGKYPEEYLCHKGDLVVAMTQQAEGLLGSTALVPEDNKYLHNQRIGLITCDETQLNKSFAYYLFMTKSVREQLERSSSGTKVKHTSPERIYDVEVEIPDLSSQEKIAKLLMAVDGKISANLSINDNLQHQMKLLYDYWFTQFDFPNQTGNPYRSSGGKMIWNEELKREIPIGWSVKTLADLLYKNTEAFDFSSEQPTIDLSVMPSDSIALSEINSSSNFTTNLYCMKQGDILFGSIRPYLHKAGFAPCDGVVAGTVHSYRVFQTQDYNFSLMTLCRDMFFDYAVNLSSGTKMPVISSDAILSYKVAYSQEIVSLFNNIDLINTIANNVQENIKLKSLRDWLLPMLMNGQATIED